MPTSVGVLGSSDLRSKTAVAVDFGEAWGAANEQPDVREGCTSRTQDARKAAGRVFLPPPSTMTTLPLPEVDATLGESNKMPQDGAVSERRTIPSTPPQASSVQHFCARPSLVKSGRGPQRDAQLSPPNHAGSKRQFPLGAAVGAPSQNEQLRGFQCFVASAAETCEKP
ncbi:hypothetical protein CYMTET_5225 [Cymbomonas tetramitiformis]|uniref:Uncharacterized protein n=1 Tax=Cymbomonas tetramitiformis TaxID=36881 RepID=A0AAE0GZV2_9CHLO|nr:hypothetical protein CYMTET_5225 [Cymbomonas tetramitiformis]